MRYLRTIVPKCLLAIMEIMRFGPVGKVLLHRDADMKLQMSRLNSTTKPPRTENANGLRITPFI